MNHHGTLGAPHNGHRRRPRNDGAPAPESPQAFNAFGAPGDNRSRRRPLNTAAASAAADSQRSTADDFWSTNQGWADSGNGSADRAWSEPQSGSWSEPQPNTWVAEPQPSNWAEPQPGNWSGGEWNNDNGWNRDNKPAWHSDPNWNTHQSWSEAQNWSDEPPYRDHAEPAPSEQPTTIAEALAKGHAIAEPQADPQPARSRGAHRVAAPPSALKGRAAVVAVAAGAVVAAGQCATADPGSQKQQQATDYEAAGSVHEIAAQSASAEVPAAAPGGTTSPQMLSGGAPLDTSRFGEMLANGAEFAQDLARAEEAKYRPLFASFASGSYTSGFGARWGVQHLGVDIAAPIGTPIYAVADGEVIDAGPASGFGMWVRLLHADGTITVYGHVDTTTVSVGEYVLAGDQIATMGNRGFSTGPHCHFEVWLNGSNKVDPIPWLATRGISLTGPGD